MLDETRLPGRCTIGHMVDRTIPELPMTTPMTQTTRARVLRAASIAVVLLTAAACADKAKRTAATDSVLARDLALAGQQTANPTFQDTAVATRTKAGGSRAERAARSRSDAHRAAAENTYANARRTSARAATDARAHRATAADGRRAGAGTRSDRRVHRHRRRRHADERVEGLLVDESAGRQDRRDTQLRDHRIERRGDSRGFDRRARDRQRHAWSERRDGADATPRALGRS